MLVSHEALVTRLTMGAVARFEKGLSDCFKDGKVVAYSATAFFVTKPDDRLGEDRGFEYLVTNRHAVQPGIEDGAPCQIVNYVVKLNLRSSAGGSKTVANLR